MWSEDGEELSQLYLELPDTYQKGFMYSAKWTSGQIKLHSNV